ncbi:Proliferation-associated protein 2G4 [Araneus ventricosus]|uniref:Proliferation-associated protein 2G4 n=1 Tax=Araneus ventricosus TaxID=182803 RepID=A0A4Y2FN80_ARAVE|nr:Proliferation-associated protein 2G4 [Araneus ventricosus]
MADKEDSGEPTIAQDLVVTKYKMAGEMVTRVLNQLIEKCKPGASVISICEAGDQMLEEETGKVFKKEKEMKKGIAFPTCVSVNNCICHFSPLKSEADYILKDGDMVKLDLGAHIDGFVAVVAHTVVVGASKDNKVTGRKADVIHAAHFAAEAALRLVKPAGDNNTVTETIQKVAESFKCKPVEGMLSHQLKQYRIDGEKSIIQNPTEAQRKEHEKCEFEVHEVYAVDVLISTGEGKGREMDTRTTVFKKTDEVYQLKMKASRAFFSEVDKKFGNMPFTLRSFEDEKKARMGVVECVNHKLVEPFTVLYEKEGEFVAQFKFTVLLMPSGSHKITAGPVDLDIYETTHEIEDESLKSLLNRSVAPKSQKKKKKRAEKAIANSIEKNEKVTEKPVVVETEKPAVVETVKVQE